MPQINAVTLYVQDIETSVAFYSHVLEREVMHRNPFYAVFLQESGAQLVLMAQEAVEPRSFAIGGVELAFALYEDAEVDALHRQWVAAGVPIAQAPARNAFSYSFLAMDPDGHRLRVYANQHFRATNL